MDLLLAAITPPIIAYLIGGGILGLRGHYFAIGTLGLGVAAGELAGGVGTIGGTAGMMVPVFPNDVGNIHTDKIVFYYLSLILALKCFSFFKMALFNSFWISS